MDQSQTPHEHHAPVAPAPVAQDSGFMQREMNGATFLTLEHVGHMVLVVLVPMLILGGFASAFSIWTGSGGLEGIVTSSVGLVGTGAKALEATLALSVVAALMVLVPLLVVLDRRTRAEWHKRPGYANRLAYKVPVYSALAILAAFIVSIVVGLLNVVLESLAFIGIPDAPIGSLYLADFLPSLIALVVVVGTAWYLFKLAKGHDNGRMFSIVTAAVSAALVITLLITSIATLHGGDNTFVTPGITPATPTSPTQNPYYQNLYNQ